MLIEYLTSLRRGVALAVLLAAAPALARAQSTPAQEQTTLRLSDLLLQVQANSPVLRAARLEAEALDTRKAQVTALPDPFVSVGYRPLAVRDASGAVPSRIMAQQMIPYPGKLRLAGEAAAYEALAARHNADALALDLAYEVKEAYYELYRVREQDRLLAAFQEQVGGFVEAAAVKYEVGQGAQQAVLKAQLERSTLARRRLDLAAMGHHLLQELARLTNRPELAAHPDHVVLERPALGTMTAELPPGSALANRPEAAALEAALKEAETRIELAEAAYRPDFMVGVGIMDMMAMDATARPLDNLGNRFAIEAGVALPLNRAGRDAALVEARLRREQLEARYEALQTEIRTEFNHLKISLQDHARTLALYESTLIPQAEATLESTLVAYTTDRTGFLNLLDAQRMVFDLRLEYEEAYAEYLTARAALERTLGVASLEQLQTGLSVQTK